MAHLPIGYTHPVAWVNPVILRATAALTAAWVNSTEISVAGAGSIALSFTYTRTEADDGFEFQVQTSIYSIAGNVPAGAGEWDTEAIYAPAAVVAGADTDSLVQREYQSYTATGAGAETFLYGPLDLDHVIERLRIRVRETGDPQEGGTLVIVAELFT